MKVLLGMSGGVDSSAAAAILKNQGYDVSGLTLCLWGDCSKAQDDSKAVCKTLCLDHYSLDLKDEFDKEVISYFIDTYINGFTPNPCIVCNNKIKFGAMLENALNRGFDKIATGHYARIEKSGERYLLKRAKDLSKDQSYVLYGLNQHQLSHTLLPLGGYAKSEIRELAGSLSLITADKKDSQDICFVENGDYVSFIKSRGYEFESGDFVFKDGSIIGRHSGIIGYTVGQRKGLGIAMGHPVFVISKDTEKNRVIIGEESDLFKKFVRVKNVNFIPFDKLNTDMKVTAKLRYRHEAASAVIHPVSDDEILIEFDKAQRAAALGQSAVFYDGDTVVGGGVICGV